MIVQSTVAGTAARFDAGFQGVTKGLMIDRHGDLEGLLATLSKSVPLPTVPAAGDMRAGIALTHQLLMNFFPSKQLRNGTAGIESQARNP
jgi:hypothetical protein